MSGFAQNIVGSCIGWDIAILLLIHALLVGLPRISKKIKIPVIALALAGVVWIMWNPVVEEYRKEHPPTPVPAAEKREAAKNPVQQSESEDKATAKVIQAAPVAPTHPKGKVAVRIEH